MAICGLEPVPAGDDDAGMSPLDRLPFDNRTARLPETLFARVAAQPHGRHHLVHASADALALLDLPPDITADPDFVEVFSGRRVPAGAEPIATVYAGHQFGIWVPQLGDGRALLLGERVNRRGERWEV
ncbi:MAG TPA: protein adenylyltransferase SelO family protein, partial [Plasticicumulans sp.]|nr:protein adenylyltransferase SelO family protein [Plasticicumulans sp.]